MAKFVFPFTKRRTRDGTVFEEPKIPVTFNGPDGRFFDTLAILDTGSTISHLPLAVAEALGFSKESAKTATSRGIGGEEQMAEFEVGLKISRKNQTTKTLRLPIPVFLNPDVDYCSLGLCPLFEMFDVSFRMADGKIEMKERRTARMETGER